MFVHGEVTVKLKKNIIQCCNNLDSFQQPHGEESTHKPGISARYHVNTS